MPQAIAVTLRKRLPISARFGAVPGYTWAYAERARAVCDPTVIEVRGGDHPMLRRAPL